MAKNDVNSIEEQIKKLQEKKKAIKKTLNSQNRKDRTRRLIQTGALVENYFDIEHLSLEEREEIFKLFSDYIKNNMPLKYKKYSCHFSIIYT